MKPVFLTLLMLLAGIVGLQGQHMQSRAPQAGEAANPEAAEATAQLQAKYSLDSQQAQTMYDIQLRKFDQMRQIEALRDANPGLYAKKLENVQRGALASIKRLLNNDAQRQIFQQTQVTVREKRAKARQEQMKEGKSQTSIHLAVLSIYEE